MRRLLWRQRQQLAGLHRLKQLPSVPSPTALRRSFDLSQ
jgi:hypothetical protein